MKKYNILSLILFLFLFSGCTKDYNLDQSIFIEDKENPNLPIYSEWGYNAFGVYIDRRPFVSNKYDLPAKIIVSQNTLTLQMVGNYNYNKTILKFSFTGYSIDNFQQLVELNKKVIDLTTGECIIQLVKDDKTVEVKPFSGQFNFKRVQNLNVDEEATKSIISGEFYFQAFIDGDPVAISKGRFDFGIGNDNFYKFD